MVPNSLPRFDPGKQRGSDRTGRARDPGAYDLEGVDQDIAPRLMAMVSPRRFWHSKQVARLAVSLARRWGLDTDAARRAGLLHDICREQRHEWPQLAAWHSIVLPYWAGGDLGHLHGPLAAVLARQEFGLPEPWCGAIAAHTSGTPEMTREETVLYIADHACDGRRDAQVPRWRELAHTDLDAAAIEMLAHLLFSLLGQGAMLWEPSVLGRNRLLLRQRERAGGA